jgi:hypothetical protein
MNAPARIMEDDLPATSRKCPRRIAQAIALKIEGEVDTWTEAAARAGVTREHLSRSLKKDHVKAFLERKSREHLANSGPEAITTVVRIMQTSKNERTKLLAAEMLFQANQLYPKQGHVAVNVSVTPGYVIDLSGPPAAERVIGHQSFLEPKPLIDMASVPGEEWGTRFEDANPVNPEPDEGDE